jgi:hypothetical protein
MDSQTNKQRSSGSQVGEVKIEQFWRDATAADIAKVMKGEQLQARFRDKCVLYWTEHYLCGVNGRHWIAGNFRWDLCQVYDPPQWYLDKPDPGEGWRLLEKFPDEAKLATDEFFDTFDNVWLQVGDTECAQYHGVWYRRRIEANIPEKLDSSRSKDYIPNGWTKIQDDEPRLASDAYWSQGAKDWVIIGDARLESSNREKWPAIRRVENQISMKLMADCCYTLPSGHSICVTETGFEVLLCHGRT